MPVVVGAWLCSALQVQGAMASATIPLAAGHGSCHDRSVPCRLQRASGVEVGSLREQVASLLAENAVLREKIVELCRQFNRDSVNSGHLPPQNGPVFPLQTLQPSLVVGP